MATLEASGDSTVPVTYAPENSPKILKPVTLRLTFSLVARHVAEQLTTVNR